MATIITELQKRGISIFLDGDDIRFKAADGVDSDFMPGTLSPRREEVRQYLRARDSVAFFAIAPSQGAPIASPVQEMWWNWIDREASLTLSLIEFVKLDDLARIVDAVRGVVVRHEALRARFRESGGNLTVVPQPADAFDVEIEILGPSPLSRETLKAHIDAFTARPLCAGSERLVRSKIFAVPGHGHVVVIVANHLVVDGTSMDLIRAGLRRHLREGAPAPIGAGAAAGYQGFAAWQKDCLERSGDALSRYWRTWSGNQRDVFSPSGKTPMRWQPGRKIRRTFAIPAFAQAAVADAARRYSTFPFLVYLAVFSLAIARWNGQRSFPLRCICDGRVRPELASVVGLMTGADALSVNIEPGAGLAEILKDLEREYHAAARLRLPNIYAFAPFATSSRLDAGMQEHNVAIVLNYRKAVGHAGGTAPSSGDTSWPPAEGLPRQDHWRHAVSPICLELTQLDGVATAAFLLHEDILSVGEQDALIQSFFAVFRERLLECREDGHATGDYASDSV